MVTLIFYWKNLGLLLPALSEPAVIALGTLAVLPTVFALDFGQLWLIGLVGVVACCLIVVATASALGSAAVLAAASPEPLPPMPLGWIGEAPTVSVGIYILSLAGHAALPSVYASMAQPSQYNRALDLSFGLMFAIYVTEAVCGYLAFGWLRGEAVDVLVSNNLTAWPSGPLSTFMTAAVVGKSFCSVSPLMGVVAETPEALLGWQGLRCSDGEVVDSAGSPMSGPKAREPPLRVTPLRRRGLRVALLLLTSGCAYPCSVYGLLPLVEALTGAMCSMFASIVLPGARAARCMGCPGARAGQSRTKGPLPRRARGAASERRARPVPGGHAHPAPRPRLVPPTFPFAPHSRQPPSG